VVPQLRKRKTEKASTAEVRRTSYTKITCKPNTIEEGQLTHRIEKAWPVAERQHNVRRNRRGGGTSCAGRKPGEASMKSGGKKRGRYCFNDFIEEGTEYFHSGKEGTSRAATLDPITRKGGIQKKLSNI